MDAPPLDAEFLQMVRHLLLDEFPGQIRACLDALSEEDVWWRPNERFSIAPQWQRVRHRDLATGIESHSDLWSAQIQATLIPDVLTVQASWSDTRDTLRALAPLDDQRSDNHGGAFDLAYRPTPGRGVRARCRPPLWRGLPPSRLRGVLASVLAEPSTSICRKA